MTLRLVAAIVAALATFGSTIASANEEANAVAAARAARAAWTKALERQQELRADRDRTHNLVLGLSERYKKMCSETWTPQCKDLFDRIRDENKDRIAADNAYRDYTPVEEKAYEAMMDADKKVRDIQLAPKPARTPDPTIPMPSPFSGAGPALPPPPPEAPTPMPSPFSGAGPVMPPAPPAVTGRRNSDGSLTCFYRDGGSSWNFTTRDPSFKDCPTIPPGHRPINPASTSPSGGGGGGGGGSSSPSAGLPPGAGGSGAGPGYGGSGAGPGYGPGSGGPGTGPGFGGAGGGQGFGGPGVAPGAARPGPRQQGGPYQPGGPDQPGGNNTPNAGGQGGAAPNSGAPADGPRSQPDPRTAAAPTSSSQQAPKPTDQRPLPPEKGYPEKVDEVCTKSSAGPNRYDCVPTAGYCIGKPGTAAAAKPFVQCRECKANECDPWTARGSQALCPANVTNISQCQYGGKMCENVQTVYQGGGRYSGDCKPGVINLGTLPPLKPQALPLRYSAAPMRPHPQPSVQPPPMPMSPHVKPQWLLPSPMVHQKSRPQQQSMQHPQKQHPQKIPHQQAMAHPQKQQPQKIPQQQAMAHPQKQQPQKIPQQQAMQHPQKQHQPQKGNLGPSNKYANLGSQGLKQNYKPQSFKQQSLKQQGLKQQGLKQQGLKRQAYKQPASKPQGQKHQSFKQSGMKQSSFGGGRKRYR